MPAAKLSRMTDTIILVPRMHACRGKRRDPRSPAPSRSPFFLFSAASFYVDLFSEDARLFARDSQTSPGDFGEIQDERVARDGGVERAETHIRQRCMRLPSGDQRGLSCDSSPRSATGLPLVRRSG